MSKEAIEKSKEILKGYENKLVYEISEKDKKAVKILLQYIDQLEQENSRQSKMIDLMAKEITSETLTKEQWCPMLNKKECHQDDTCLQCLKQYFEKKVEG